LPPILPSLQKGRGNMTSTKRKQQHAYHTKFVSPKFSSKLGPWLPASVQQHLYNR